MLVSFWVKSCYIQRLYSTDCFKTTLSTAPSWLYSFLVTLSISLGLSCQSVQPAQRIDTLAALGQDTVKLLTNFAQGATNWFQTLLEPKSSSAAASSSSTIPSNGPSPSKSHSVENPQEVQEYPENFEPLRSRCLVDIYTPCTPIMKNPFVSPLLAPDSLLKGLPPVHIVVRHDENAFPGTMLKLLF